MWLVGWGRGGVTLTFAIFGVYKGTGLLRICWRTGGGATLDGAMFRCSLGKDEYRYREKIDMWVLLYMACQLYWLANLCS